MDALLAVLFAAHLNVAAQVPPELGVEVYYAAQAENVAPYDLATMLITEKSGPDRNFSLLAANKRWANGTRYDYDPEAVGADGEMGHFQLIPYWRAKFEDEHDLDDLDLHDPSTNVRIAAYVVAQAQKSHDEHASEPGARYHDWVAHWKCATAARNTQCGQCGYAKRKAQIVKRSLFNLELTRDLVRPILKPYWKHCRENS